jgi:MFS family permease
MRLFTRTRGYASGLTLSTIYFCGFSGIWLVLSLFFQNGLGYSALAAGLAVTPFALGSTVSAAVAGRLVANRGRRVTVAGLVLVITGLVAAAIVLPLVDARFTGWAVALPLLVAGLGGGAVISPNTTLTLSRVPTAMAGAAGGALQTGQRMGTAIGTAVLATAYRVTVTGTHGHFAVATATAIGISVAFVCAALVVAIRELRLGRAGTNQPDQPAAATSPADICHRSDSFGETTRTGVDGR